MRDSPETRGEQGPGPEDADQGLPKPIDGDEFRSAYGEALADTLDLTTWHLGENLAALYGRLEKEVQEAVQQESRIRERVRKEILPLLGTREGAPPGAGVYQATVDQIELVHNGLLFSGAVEACDGNSVVHDTLPVTIAQIGVCLVSYRGDQGSWVHRLFRRDLRVGGLDPVAEALDVLEKRQRRGGYDMQSPRDTLSSLARRGIMAYAERAVLVDKSQAPWRMGHGSPAPYELITGSGMKELLAKSLDLLQSLLCRHRKFVFVPSAPAQRTLLTIGNALRPLEYAVVDTMQDGLLRIAGGHYRGEGWVDLLKAVNEFARDVGSRVAMGIYRASVLSPPQIFYAHVDHVHEAALIAMADSALQEHRGFPMLIDLADTVCHGSLGGDSLLGAAEAAYARAGEPFRYANERQTRR